MSVAVAFDTLPDGTALSGLTLTAPRANALTPQLLQDLSDALDRAEAAGAAALLISGGRNFSTGGDVAAFRDAAARGEARAFAARLVPQLQEIVLRLVALPCLVAVAARGAVTGGAAGLLFAADVAAVHPGCFVQPYYARVGFAPDGGWTALLPDRIGAGRAARWLLCDRRLTGPALVEAGLADTCDAEPEAAARRLLADGRTGAQLAAKALIWDAARRSALRERLHRETDAFLDRIDRGDTRAGMDAFLAAGKETSHV
ncbi:enoyl-CoA hydratase/isomerase family protein [Psychromarinibacter sp. C21-152]|uniref:Enoyl-CoA hydratase/isomerase family protein n=1 Tax=Psychromarinibacter sediminicola TaxID=3033385 RepID=A0AAE3T827_9RHOB|nr:enoyl-CoA hydratase/isomerase family protein [Psychromarinibacter sediminicola]MDF0599649.1 enoyl-CoA hydratase/isomerase family protein [Psychromarinibacter sediminicola]